jgi:hypothetical protein
MGGTGARMGAAAVGAAGTAAPGSFRGFPGPQAANTAAAARIAAAAAGDLLRIALIVIALSLGACCPDYKAAARPSQ